MVPRDSHTESARSFLEVVQGERLRLLSVAYNLLGSASDAEDAVQEAYLRWYRQPPSERNAIKTPGAWLTKVVTRICLDQLRSARKRSLSWVFLRGEPLDLGFCVVDAVRVQEIRCGGYSLTPKL
ncbi:sigma factor [Brachybacterium fresconis]|uniref:sigma factor n=1 Tax=Brachybacterium fresconis TaxID=173363 RepID=UPI001FD93A2A|nr:sigma factor [Brachybacterium fresconis]